jgi:uncharacterized protein YukE
MPVRFTEIRCDTMGVMIAASRVRIDKANANVAEETKKLQNALSQFAQCKAGLEGALLARAWLGEGANVEGWQAAYELWKSGLELSRMAYQSAIKEVMDANAEFMDLPSSSGGYRAAIRRGDYKWQRYLREPRYAEFWNLDLTSRARWMLPPIAVVAVMIGTFVLPIAGKVLFATMGSARHWVGDGFSKKPAPTTADVPTVDSENSDQDVPE